MNDLRPLEQVYREETILIASYESSVDDELAALRREMRGG